MKTMTAKCKYAPAVPCDWCGAQEGYCNPECIECRRACEAQPKLPCEWNAEIKVIRNVRNSRKSELTCDKCPYGDYKHRCEFAYDAYNTNGDCLAEK